MWGIDAPRYDTHIIHISPDCGGMLDLMESRHTVYTLVRLSCTTPSSSRFSACAKLSHRNLVLFIFISYNRFAAQ